MKWLPFGKCWCESFRINDDFIITVVNLIGFEQRMEEHERYGAHRIGDVDIARLFGFRQRTATGTVVIICLLTCEIYLFIFDFWLVDKILLGD